MLDEKKLDLDSLDQLLDEAELMQLTGGTPVDLPAAPLATPAVSPPVTEAPKPTLPPTPVPEKATEEPLRPAAVKANDAKSKSAQDKKKSSNDSKQDAWTEQEMDGIKKLIIIFGSSILVVSLAAAGIALGGLFKSAKPSPEMLTALEETQSGIEETYKLAEGSNRELKDLGQRLTEIVTQLSDAEAAINDVKAIGEEQLQRGAAMPAMPMPAVAPKKIVAEVTPESSTVKSAPVVNDAQVSGLSADMKDIKRRLATTYKALESLQKQSAALQTQSEELMSVIKSVETEVKSRKAVKSSSSAKPAAPKTTKPVEETYSNSYRDENTYRYVPPKPVDDAAARMRWQQQMDKTDSFP